MRTIKLIICAITAIFFLNSCGQPPVCKSYSPFEFDWHGYNSVSTFKKHFGGYEQTILDHIGDTARVYGCTCFKMYGYEVTQRDSRDLLLTFFDENSGSAMYVQNDSNQEIPMEFYDKTLYVTGTVMYVVEMGCNKGAGLQLISVDTIPKN